MSLKPWYLLPASLAHSLSEPVINLIGSFASAKDCSWQSKKYKNLFFRNPAGIAGGVDKNATQIKAWWNLGCGFTEIGTVTPRPQSPNPGKITDRNINNRAVWNKMGFPGKGLAFVKKQLAALPEHKTPVFINVGKNRDTPNDRASEDYISCIKELAPFADAFIVNISSPNTKGLRELLLPENLKSFLSPILVDKPCPVLLKLSPDMDDQQLKSAIDTSLELDIDGWVLTNTTSERYNIDFPKDGGMSGAPLAELSKQTLKTAVAHLKNRKKDRLIVSVGGVMNYNDVCERLSLGADLVQVYSALVFEGPYFFKKLAKEARKKHKDHNE